MVKAQRHKGEDGPSHPDDLTGEVAALDGKKTRQTDQPVAAYAAQEYHLPLRGDLFLGGEVDNFGAVGGVGEDVAVAEDDGDHEEGAGDVSEEGEGPVDEHFGPGETVLEDGDGGELV